jgi:signal transduction histidine kinase
VSELAAERPVARPNRLLAAARNAAYLVAGLALELAGVVTLPALSWRSSLPWRLNARERRLANVLLHGRVPRLPGAETPAARRIALFTPLRLAAIAAAGLAAAAPIALTVLLALYAAEGLSGSSDRYLGPWELDRLAGAVLAVLALAAAVVTVAVLDGLGRPLRATARRLLATASPQPGASLDALAETIGDRSLSVAYWLPDRGVFVDEHGLPVELPDAVGGRTSTIVEHDGQRLAAIVHDADLDAGPELVRAAAAGAVLALENERLKAALRARVEELRSSRARIVEAGIDARRELERDLHGGAQQHLVALSLELQMLRARVAEDPESLRILDSSLGKLSNALAELRELARGIHPAILTHRGLGPAITALIDRVQLPVEWEDELDERLAPSSEAAAYFVVLEGLTNAVEHGNATRAVVRVRREAGAITVEVEDDGVGGANPALGSGLRELEDRVGANDGTLTIDSPPGLGTRIRAWIPAPPAELPQA